MSTILVEVTLPINFTSQVAELQLGIYIITLMILFFVLFEQGNINSG